MPCKTFAAASVVLGLAPFLVGAAPIPTWRPLDPADTLVIDTTKGRIVVEMTPAFAPLAVARVKLLAREGVYDGLQFHRVIDHFVDQTGNPNNRDGGTSTHPDLPPEFTFKLAPGRLTPVRRSSDAQQGFVGASPVEAVSAQEASRAPGGELRAWGAYCPGVAGMGRQADPGTANSEIFFMRDAARRLDRDYAVWGKVVVGLDVVRAVAVGEPPARPDRMVRVRVASDLPDAERPKVEVMNERSAAFAGLVAKARRAGGADFTVCDVEVPVRGRP
ncbi:MAG TPA: peptidylprolyl isomerase [Phenylobacterium sp.]|nr:peptidylprolyl isomerase [Phenylobacterium sp.]